MNWKNLSAYLICVCDCETLCGECFFSYLTETLFYVRYCVLCFCIDRYVPQTKNRINGDLLKLKWKKKSILHKTYNVLLVKSSHIPTAMLHKQEITGIFNRIHLLASTRFLPVLTSLDKRKTFLKQNCVYET